MVVVARRWRGGAGNFFLILSLAIDFVVRLVDLLEGHLDLYLTLAVPLAVPLAVVADFAGVAIGVDQHLLLCLVHVRRKSPFQWRVAPPRVGARRGGGSCTPSRLAPVGTRPFARPTPFRCSEHRASPW